MRVLVTGAEGQLGQSVRKCAEMIADVEVGSFLSSGIDSSYIAEAAKVDKTFTVGFESPDGDRYNEIGFAKDFAKTIGVSFTTVNRWENGKAQPNIKAMKALKAFCVEHGYPYELLEKSWHEQMIENVEP